MAQVIDRPEVLTLEEAADYLRLPPSEVRRLVAEQDLPGREINGEWRFLKAGLEDWLCHRSGRAILLAQAGALADDDALDQLRAQVYKERGRPEAE
jgi:excisionase family DNA binding protein